MKTKNLLIAAMLLLTGAKINATDLCVAENGAGGCYSTITDAINAASNGDRIIINPKAGGSPYAENLAVTKSLQFLCNVEGGQWVMSGSILITPAIGRTITFIGMKNLNGTITPTGTSPSGARCNVNIMNCEIVSGSIAFDFDNFNMTIVSNVLTDGNVQIRYGKIIGNDLSNPVNYGPSYSTINIGNDALATNDSIFIVGNRVTGYPANGYYNIYSNTTNQFLYISNNYVKSTSSSSSYAINIQSCKNSLLGRNTVSNNTLYSAVSLTGIYLYNISVNASVDVYNNLILAASGTGIYYYGSGPVAVSYNLMNNPMTISGVTNDGTNNISSNTTLDINNRPNSGSDAINGGSPDEAYYDINLTRNDAGVYGGSLTQDNFFPVTGAARVFFVRAPRKVTLGSDLNIKGEAFDR